MSIIITILLFVFAFILVYVLVANWQQVVVRRLVTQSLLSIVIFLVGISLFQYLTFQQVPCLPNCFSANLMGRDLANTVLRQVNFTDANLRNADLSNADLFNADLTGAILRGANLRSANLRSAKLIGADISGADLRGAILNAVDLRGAILVQADLTQIDLRETKLKGAVFDNAKLIEVDFRNTDLSGISFLNANLNGANLGQSNLSGAKLSGADLSSAILTESNLRGAWLNIATLTGADMRNAHLEGIQAIGASFASADMSNGNLTGASLIGADLSGANLQSATLQAARLFVSELSSQDFDIDDTLKNLNEIETKKVRVDVNLNGVHLNNKIVWPEGKQVLLASILGDEALVSQQQVTSGEETLLLDESSELPDETTIVSTDTLTSIIDVPLSDNGEIVLEGSITVAPLTQLIYNRFFRDGFTHTLTINATSSDAGFESFCQSGESHVVMATRSIREEESADCAKIDRRPIEFLIGVDALAIVVNANNDFIDDVAQEDLLSVFSQQQWLDVNPTWPDEDISHFIPDDESGTFQFFVERVFGGDREILTDASNMIQSADDEELVQGVAFNQYAIGFLDYSHFSKNQEILKILSVEGIEPSKSSIGDGTYPLARPIFLYSDVDVLQQNLSVAQFVSYYLSHTDESIEEMGYFPVSQDVLDNNLALLAQIVPPEILIQPSQSVRQEPSSSITESVRLTEVVVLTTPIQSELMQDITSLKGSFTVAGSSTLTPLTQAMYSLFIEEGYSGQESLKNIGSGVGFQLFCKDGESDIVMSSRPITEEEIEMCQQIGRSPIEFRVGTDAVAIVVNPSNEFVEDVSIEELKDIFTARQWLDVNTEWPNTDIIRFLPDQESGTFDFFIEAIFDGDTSILEESANIEFSSDDSQLVQAIALNQSAIGLFGYTYYLQNNTIVRPLLVEGILPNTESVDQGKYPLSRGLYLYSDSSILREKPQVAAFLHFYLTHVNDVSERLGYFPVNQEVLDKAKQELETIVLEKVSLTEMDLISMTVPITESVGITITAVPTNSVTTKTAITITSEISQPITESSLMTSEQTVSNSVIFTDPITEVVEATPTLSVTLAITDMGQDGSTIDTAMIITSAILTSTNIPDIILTRYPLD